jgi:hypothetical protein
MRSLAVTAARLVSRQERESCLTTADYLIQHKYPLPDLKVRVKSSLQTTHTYYLPTSLLQEARGFANQPPPHRKEAG